jgi:pimeloyl-ACP methyl ester carboxylesterase
MPQVELSSGMIEYEDTGGQGPVIVLLHGLLMDGSLWRKVVPELRAEFRCVLPTLPLGGHRIAMKPAADLTIRGQARIVSEFLERLDLRDVTLVFNDWGAAQVMIAQDGVERVGRLVLCSCEAFDNYPPGLPGRMIGRAVRVPGGLNAALQPLRINALRRTPMTFGWMSKRPIPKDVLDHWLQPALTKRAIRRDLLQYARAIAPKDQLLEWAEGQRAFDRPVLVAWAAEDRVMPRDHGPRLAETFPRGRFVEIPDSYTLIPEDQPQVLAGRIREFVSAEVRARLSLRPSAGDNPARERTGLTRPCRAPARSRAAGPARPASRPGHGRAGPASTRRRAGSRTPPPGRRAACTAAASRIAGQSLVRGPAGRLSGQRDLRLRLHPPDRLARRAVGKERHRALAHDPRGLLDGIGDELCDRAWSGPAPAGGDHGLFRLRPSGGRLGA